MLVSRSFLASGQCGNFENWLQVCSGCLMGNSSAASGTDGNVASNGEGSVATPGNGRNVAATSNDNDGPDPGAVSIGMAPKWIEGQGPLQGHQKPSGTKICQLRPRPPSLANGVGFNQRNFSKHRDWYFYLLPATWITWSSTKAKILRGRMTIRFDKSISDCPVIPNQPEPTRLS